MSGIIRVKKDTRYFVASNEPFNDERLSWEARGVMGYLLSKPDNWECRNQDLLNKGPAGEHKIKRILSELKKYGYMTRRQYQNEDGLFVWITEIHETPLETIPDNSSIGRLSTDGQPTNGLSTDGKPPDIVNTNLPSTESINTKEESPPPKIDYADHVLSLNGKTSEATAANPDDQWLDYSDKFTSIYHRKTTHYPNEDEKARLSDFAAEGEYTPAQWEAAITECNLHYTGRRLPVLRVIEVCEAGGTWEKWKESKWPSDNGESKPAVYDIDMEVYEKLQRGEL